MPKQLYYEDVEVDMELPPLVKTPTTEQLVKWAGASGDYYQIHYDKDFAQSIGLPGIIVHGRLKASLLAKLLTDWINDEGTVKKIAVQHRRMDFPEQPITYRGRVTAKYIQDDEHVVECEIWTENSEGERTAPGSAVVVLPSRE